MHDFFCTKPDDMHYKVLADRARYFKETEEYKMTLSLHMSEAEERLIHSGSEISKVSISDFVREAALKAARNAEYLAMLDESDRQLREGRVVVKTMGELEAMAAE